MYHQALEAPREVKAAAAPNLEGIDRRLWITVFFPSCRYDQNTSNIIESLNGNLKLKWELFILDMLKEICHITMDKWSRRRKEADRAPPGQTPTNYYYRLYQEAHTFTQRNPVQRAGHLPTQVRHPEGIVHGVYLEQYTCTCMK